jgi:electron transfer flavoprotein beta subunit
MVKVAALLSVGRHPASGRTRRAPLDARGLELALGLPTAEIHAVHAGDPSETALRDYLGMGLARLAVLEMPPDRDPVPALAAYLAALRPNLILAGAHAEGGEDSGMVPYLIAQALGYTLVSDVAGLSVESGQGVFTQALPRGRRIVVEARLPAVAVVNAAAPAPRQSAFARAWRGVIETVAADAPIDAFLEACEIRPWRPRPKPVRMMRGGSALDRLRSLTETKTGEGAVMINPAPEDAARAIYEYLAAKRFIEDR